MASRTLSIIIPAYSGHDQLRHCLESLQKSQYTDFRVIVVDHGVTDSITQWVNHEFPRTICIRGDDALWWSGATNLGIRHALETGSDYVMLLNHDCYVRPETIGLLVECTDDKPDAVIAPLQHNIRTHKDIIGATSFFLLGFSTIIPPATWYKFRYRNDLVPTSLIIGGRGVIISADILNKAGYFDEANLPHYGADHDFYFRCRKSGKRLYVSTRARVDIDDTMTTRGDLNGDISLKDFVHTVKNRRSHRNIKDLNTLFKRYYPLPGLAALGVALYVLRYSLVYLFKMVIGKQRR